MYLISYKYKIKISSFGIKIISKPGFKNYLDYRLPLNILNNCGNFQEAHPGILYFLSTINFSFSFLVNSQHKQKSNDFLVYYFELKNPKKCQPLEPLNVSSLRITMCTDMALEKPSDCLRPSLCICFLVWQFTMKYVIF